MSNIPYKELTPMERRIFKSIVFENLDIPGLVKKYTLQRSTITEHLTAICYKLLISGYNRVFQIQAMFWKEFLMVLNCSYCKFWDKENGTCDCKESPFFQEAIPTLEDAQNMICTHLQKTKEGKEECVNLSKKHTLNT